MKITQWNQNNNEVRRIITKITPAKKTTIAHINLGQQSKSDMLKERRQWPTLCSYYPASLYSIPSYFNRALDHCFLYQWPTWLGSLIDSYVIDSMIANYTSFACSLGYMLVSYLSCNHSTTLTLLPMLLIAVVSMEMSKDNNNNNDPCVCDSFHAGCCCWR